MESTSWPKRVRTKRPQTCAKRTREAGKHHNLGHATFVRGLAYLRWTASEDAAVEDAKRQLVQACADSCANGLPNFDVPMRAIRATFGVFKTWPGVLETLTLNPKP